MHILKQVFLLSNNHSRRISSINPDWKLQFWCLTCGCKYFCIISIRHICWNLTNHVMRKTFRVQRWQCLWHILGCHTTWQHRQHQNRSNPILLSFFQLFLCIFLQWRKPVNRKKPLGNCYLLNVSHALCLLSICQLYNMKYNKYKWYWKFL